MSNKLPTEAFDFYVSLGPERTHAKVAEEYDVSVRAASKCASREDWSARLEKIESESRERTDKRLGETLDDIRVRLPRFSRLVSERYNAIGADANPRCTYCGMGQYLLRGKDSESVAALLQKTPVTDHMRILVCNYCGHMETFHTEYLEINPWKRS